MSVNRDKKGWEQWEKYKKMRSDLYGPWDMSSDLEKDELSDSDLYYRRKIVQSDGFYVDPRHSTSVGIRHISFNSEDKDDICIKLAQFAIDTFNQRRHSFEDTHGELKFVTLLFATGHSVSGTMYYLTFDAVNLGNGITYTYQAIVHNSMSDLPNIVRAFRLQRPPGLMKTWFWKDHCCVDVGKYSNVSASWISNAGAIQDD